MVLVDCCLFQFDQNSTHEACHLLELGDFLLVACHHAVHRQIFRQVLVTSAQKRRIIKFLRDASQ